MEYLIVTFRSRSETFRFAEILRDRGIFAEIVSTPKEARIGCGLSVKTRVGLESVIKRLIRINGLKTFVALFLVRIVGVKRAVYPI